MTDTPENRRTETARQNDDSAIIDAAAANPTPTEGSRSGGDVATDIATQGAAERVPDPDAMEGVTAEDDRAHGQAYPPHSGGAWEGKVLDF